MYNSISSIAKAGSLKSFSARLTSSRSYAYSASPVKRSYNKPLSPSTRSSAASSSTATRSASSSTTSSSPTSSSGKPASSGSKLSTNEYKTTYKSRPSATTSSSAPSSSSSSSSSSQPAESNASRPSYSYSSSLSPKSTQTAQSSFQQNKGFGANSSNNGSFESPSFNSAYKTINQTFPKSLHDTPVIPESADLTTGAISNDISNGTGNNEVRFTQDPQNNIASQQHQQQQQQQIDWINSFHGIGTTLLNQKQIDILLSPLDPEDIEIKPDGLLYLPEIKYRRILNRALGPGAWGLIPRSETIVTPKLITREYALVVMGKLVSVARGEQDYFSEQGIPTATEGCKSNALMRCCKDLGIGSELWDPRFIRKFKKQYCEDKFVTHVTTGKKKKIWKRKDDTVEYPYKV